MKNEYSILVVLVVATSLAVNLSDAYAIKEPGSYTGSFSGASSSSSAYSHSSSNAYTFNGNVNPNDIHGLKETLQGSLAGTAATSGASANAGAAAGAIAGANAVGGALAGSQAIAGSSSNAGALGGSILGCSGGNGGCESGADSNAAVAVNPDDFKVIGSDKYTTGYNSGIKTNYAVSGNYVQPKPNIAGGCISCKGPFPGPNGSIHDYKLASSVPVQPAGGTAQASAGAAAHAGATTFYQPSATHINNLPGPIGNIYHSKPATGTIYVKEPGSGHVSPSLISSLPGPSGSIYDSKPASAGAVAGASAGAGSYASGGASIINVVPQQPVAPSCSDTPGSPGGCGAALQPEKVASPGPALSSIIPVLPGPSGSIHASKPASSVAHVHDSGTVAGSNSYTGSNIGFHHTTSGVTNIPTSHPVVGPICSYTPGSPTPCSAGGCTTCKGPFPGPNNSIHDYKPAPSGGHVAGTSPASSISIGCLNCKVPFPGPNGSIYDFKPAPSVSSGGYFNTGSSSFGSTGVVNGYKPVPSGAAHTGAASTASSSSGSFTGSTSSLNEYKPVPAASSGTSSIGSGSSYASGSSQLAPSIHPEAPVSTGTYYVNKPPTDVEPPSLSFTGQIPCADSSCSSVNKVPAAVPHGTPCALGKGCGASSGTQSSAGSGVVYIDKDTSGQYASINHDQAHLSGGIVYPGDDGSYHPAPSTTTKPPTIYKNAPSGGHAVSVNDADSTGILIGPGTGNLPIEEDAKPFGTQGAIGGSAAFAKTKEDKPFGTQGAFGGSAAFAKTKEDKPFGTQGAFGGSAAFSNANAEATSSREHSTGTGNLPVEEDSKPFGTQGAFGGSAAFAKTKQDKPFGTQGAFGGSAAFSNVNAEATSSREHSTGTGNLPVEEDSKPFGTQGAFGGSAAFAKTKEDKPFGTQGAFGGSAAFAKTKEDKPFGTQGAFGGSAAFSNANAEATSSREHSTGTGNLSVEEDSKPFGTQDAFGGSAAFAKNKEDKPFGTQGAFGGSAAFAKTKEDKPFGTQGAFGSSAAFSKANAEATSSTEPSTGEVTIQKGNLISSSYELIHKPTCATGICGSISSDNSNLGGQYVIGTPVKVPCSGPACGDTVVYIIEEKPSEQGCSGGQCGGATGQVLIQKGNTYDITNSGSKGNSGCTVGQCGVVFDQNVINQDIANSGSYYANGGSYGGSSGCSRGQCGGATDQILINMPYAIGGSYGGNSGYAGGANTGFATGQVLINKGGSSYDITNSGGLNSGSSQYGCGSGQCGATGFGIAGSLNPEGFLHKLFGAGGLSGTVFNKFGPNGQSGAFSRSGAYSGASAGGFANAGASASAHAGSYARSF